jgi:hypothetical protein
MSQQKIIVRQDVNFDNDERSSKSQEPPIKIEEVENLVAPKVDL